MEIKTQESVQTTSDILGTHETMHPPARRPRLRRISPTSIRKSVLSQTKQEVDEPETPNPINLAKNIVLGMGVTFIGNMPIFLEPVGFLFFNSHRIALGLIHLFLPLLIGAASVWSNQRVLDKVASFSFEGILVAISLYAFGTFIWMTGWLIIRALLFGIGRLILGFAEVGKGSKG